MIITYRLDEVCDVIMGQAPNGDAYNTEGDGWPLIAGASDFGAIYPDAKKYTTEASKLSRSGDIIIGIRASIGDKVISNVIYCLGRGVAGLRPKAKLDDRYLWHWLTHIRHELAAKAKGATFKQVNREDIGELSIALPSLEEQQRIAAILDAADTLREKRRQAMAKLDGLVQGVFLEMFGDTHNKGWKTLAVSDLVADIPNAIRTGPFGSQLLHSEFVDEGIAVLGIDNAVQNEFVWAKPRFITDKKYQNLRRYTVRSGDILITIMGTCGRCAIVPDDIPVAINTKHLCCISLDQQRCLPQYFYTAFLNLPAVLQQLGIRERGAVMPGLNMQLIKELQIPIPPIESQREFIDFLNANSQLKQKCLVSLTYLDTLFASLQQRAFRGEL